MTIKFKPADLPPARRPKKAKTGPWVPLFNKARKNPGQWFLVQGKRYTATTTHIKKGRIVGCEPGEFEAVSRNVVKGKGDIYVRYPEPVGTKLAPSEPLAVIVNREPLLPAVDPLSDEEREIASQATTKAMGL